MASHVMKTPIKTSDRDKIENSIKTIMSQAPTTIKAKWEDHGKIEWTGDALQILPDGIAQALPQDLRRRMATLYREHQIGIII
jgi:hypothetical protein